jgi:putative PIN family toxin of toxin-antitoxin system
MCTEPLLHVVIDTNVVFEGLTTQGNAAGFVIDAWLAELIKVYVSNALAYEYKDVLSRKLSDFRWQQVKPILGTLLSRSQFTTIYYSWRPTSPDPGDDLVIDCAMNANAIITTSNLRDFKKARESLGLQVMTPVELVTQLALAGS